jgi:hypothetical protein
MKKLLFVFAVFFISVSNSFAYQQTIYAGPPIGSAGMTLNINSNCSYISLNASWYGLTNGVSNGGVVAYSDQLIGEYSFMAGTNPPSYSKGIYQTLYWGTVQVYLNAYSCNGQATLQWMP